MQTREGNLIANCRDSLELVSKSASVKVTTLEELSLRSASISLSASRGLYMINGIDYFDSEPDRTKSQPSISPLDDARREAELFAYNLVIVDGILRAEAA